MIWNSFRCEQKDKLTSFVRYEIFCGVYWVWFSARERGSASSGKALTGWWDVFNETESDSLIIIKQLWFSVKLWEGNLDEDQL